MTATATQTVGQFFEAHKCVNIYSATSSMEPVAVSCKCGRYIDADRSAEFCSVVKTEEGNEFACSRCTNPKGFGVFVATVPGGELTQVYRFLNEIEAVCHLERKYNNRGEVRPVR